MPVVFRVNANEISKCFIQRSIRKSFSMASVQIFSINQHTSALQMYIYVSVKGNRSNIQM